jgi:hypothetical protein
MNIKAADIWNWRPPPYESKIMNAWNSTPTTPTYRETYLMGRYYDILQGGINPRQQLFWTQCRGPWMGARQVRWTPSLPRYDKEIICLKHYAYDHRVQQSLHLTCITFFFLYHHHYHHNHIHFDKHIWIINYLNERHEVFTAIKIQVTVF